MRLCVKIWSTLHDGQTESCPAAPCEGFVRSERSQVGREARNFD